MPAIVMVWQNILKDDIKIETLRLTMLIDNEIEDIKGIRIKVIAPSAFNPVLTGLILLKLIKDIHPQDFKWQPYPTHVNPSGANHLSLLLGIPDAEKLFDLPLKDWLNKVVSALKVSQWGKPCSPIYSMNNDVIMKKTFLPKTIRWTFYSGFVFLIIMSLLRFVFVNYFSAPASADNNLNSSYILGFRYDLRYVTIVMMITLLFSYIKPLNPFDKKLGKQIAIITWMLFSSLLLFFYTADFIHYAYVHQRLNASILSYIDNPLISMQMMWQSYPIITIIIIFLVVEWVLYKFISFTYQLSDKYERTGSQFKNIITQIIFLLFCFMLLLEILFIKVGNIH